MVVVVDGAPNTPPDGAADGVGAALLDLLALNVKSDPLDVRAGGGRGGRRSSELEGIRRWRLRGAAKTEGRLFGTRPIT